MYDELVKRLRSRAGAFDYDGRPDIACDYEQAADAIEQLSAVNERQLLEIAVLIKPRWIPVTERLPEADGSFITAYSKGYVTQNWYMTFHHGGGKWYQNSEDTGEVTHWMPLPEPPMEEA